MENKNLVADVDNSLMYDCFHSRSFKLLPDDFQPLIGTVCAKQYNKDTLSPSELRKLARLLRDYRRLVEDLDYLLFYSNF